MSDLPDNAELENLDGPEPVPRRKITERNSDILGLGWLHGTFFAAVFHRQKMTANWSASGPVQSLVEFAGALDEALEALNFCGTEVFLLLESDQFVHQSETVPALSDSAARGYLQNLVRRNEKDGETSLWVSQETLSVRQERTFMLHRLPRRYFTELNQLLLARQLDLTRILPMAVPIQRELDRFPISKGRPVLVAVEAGGATLVTVAQVGGKIIFGRTLLASWGSDLARIGLEINRSLLYAKQQFGLPVERIWLLGDSSHSAAEVNAKCGTGKQIMVLPTTPVEWLQSIAKLSLSHPVNLVAEHLRQKRRHIFVRRLLIAACWMGLGFLALDTWSREQAWTAEHRHLARLTADENVLAAERDRLAARNSATEARRAFLRQIEGQHLAPVPEKFLAYLASVLPDSIRLTDFSVKWEGAPNGWSFHLEGAVEADEETARQTLAVLQHQLTKSPLRARFATTAQSLVSMTEANGTSPTEIQRFSLEGAMLEN